MFKDRESQNGLYLPIHGKIVKGDACNLDTQLVKRMPHDMAANFKVEVVDQENQAKLFELELFKSPPSNVYKQVLRLLSKDCQYMMEALDLNPLYLKHVFNLRKISLAKEITPLSRILSFHIISKVDGVYHPAFRAQKFIPWSFQCLNGPKNFTHILADFELGSDTYQKFLEDLKKCGGNKLEAMKQAHSHQTMTNLGFKLNPEVVHYINSKESCVFALYDKVRNSK